MNNPIKLKKKRRKLAKKLNKLYNDIIICVEDLEEATTTYEIKFYTDHFRKLIKKYIKFDLFGLTSVVGDCFMLESHMLHKVLKYYNKIHFWKITIENKGEEKIWEDQQN